ncbi:succinate-semialdehyde dehydrogenase (NAD(P)(+)) [Ascoidea rubescens DSM 1968]|uniref:Succinate-semialdehyde dehydrogenase n=1 Tax=Ascoidea rubescens DSM 1968 TaxID=1344418 RepID=A0A1D2VAM0_9ASCO|nr:succinic semialdehyde dehydrogenase [Ascoidea rubescens DSM 1968]ODV58473.1 succinic semialdehyde dehydrogenase [Ascoidea rubescens DSM 1968]
MAPKLNLPELLCKGAYINGQWITDAKSKFQVQDPATLEVIGELPDQGPDDIDIAIESASAAFTTFKKTTPRERSKYLRDIYNLMIENVDDLAKIITWENGKHINEAIGEIKYAASYFEWYAEEAPRIYGTTIQPTNPTNRVFTMRQPVGVCGIITPWNFPSAMITRKAAAAIAAGCPVIIKPDHQTPYSALALAYFFDKLNLPKGIFNIVLSKSHVPEIGLKMCESTKIKKISFTGSTNIGKILMKQSASTLKKLSFELGGNAPIVVFDDADINLAISQSIASKFRGLGQTCVCANRLYIQQGIYDKFVEKFSKEVSKFKVGNGFDTSCTHGCLINQLAIDKVKDHIKDALSKGAVVKIKGGRDDSLGPNFYNPTVLSNCTQDMKVAKEETFGPLAAIFKFSDIEDVIHWSNDVEHGLASYVFSKDINNIYIMAENLEYGMISCNTGIFTDSSIPFGGVKESGFGREGSLHGIDDYTILKAVTIGNIPQI